MRSRPIRGKQPRYMGGRPTSISRSQASERGIRRAVARAAGSPEAFPGCSRSRRRHSLDCHRTHGAWGAGASLDYHPSARGWIGRYARRVAERSWGAERGSETRRVAGRPRPLRTTTRTDPSSHRLVVLKNAQYGHGRAHVADFHPELTSLPRRHPGSLRRDGKGKVTPESSIVLRTSIEQRASDDCARLCSGSA
jgi:hypothetical protein